MPTWVVMPNAATGKKKVLDGHKRVGKRFVPPFLTMVPMKDAPWLARTLPELIWLALLIDKYGAREGVELGWSVAKAAWALEEEKGFNFAFASSFEHLGDDQQHAIVSRLEEEGGLDKVRRALQPLLALYPPCPLGFLQEADQPVSPEWESDITYLKDMVGRLADRHSKLPMLAQACVPYFLGRQGKLKFSSAVTPPNLEAIATDFDSEEARRSSAQVRAMVNGIVGHLLEEVADTWPRSFWNRGMELEPVSKESAIEMVETEDASYSTAGLPREIRTYMRLVREGLDERWQMLPKDAYDSEVTEVVAALTARQVSIARRIAPNPGIWDWHVGPILLRTLVDTHITLTWILADPVERARKFIRFGLGQEKLQIEHLKAVQAEEPDKDIASVIEAREAWVNAQRYMFLLEVDVGAWSGMSTREMADEVGLQSLYNFAYAPWSSCTHSRWNHVGKFNLRNDGNPLHRYLRAPFDPEFEPQMDVLFNSAKYLELSFNAIDQHFGLKCETPGPYTYWLQPTEDGSAEDGFEDQPQA